jgi:aminopeptidase YwaD
MATTPPPARRRRPRRGSLERPVNGRLYRAAFLVLVLPLLLAAFSVTRAAPLPAPILPPAFDQDATRALAEDLARKAPDRVPGSSDALKAAGWFRDELSQYGLTVASDSWWQAIPGLGRVRLQNLWAVSAGQSRDAIVVMAHRDDDGTGPGANDNASGTAALIELARSYAQPATPDQQRVRSAHTVVFLSTDGGAFGGVGAARFASHLPFHVVAVLNLNAIGGDGAPRLVLTGDTPRSPAVGLVETTAQRVLEQAGQAPQHTSFVAQLIDLGFPFTLDEQGPLVARGVPAVTLSTVAERPAGGLADRPETLSVTHLGQLGRAAQEVIGSLDQGLELAQGTTTYVWLGGRVVRGWAIELMLFFLLIPFFVATVDLFARCRRRQIPLGPAVHSLRARLGFWLFLGAIFIVFRWFGAWPGGPARPPNPATAGSWPVGALLGLAVVGALGWLVARHRLVPRREVAVEEELAGQTVALLALAVVSLLVLATNPFALIFVLPALHIWLWLPQVRRAHVGVRAVVFLAGLAGPLLVLVSLGSRYGLGFDAPWYLLELVSTGYVHLTVVAIALAGAAATAQLATVTAGRYAPYPKAGERPALGPVRATVRAVVLGVRARRRVTEERRRAFGG